MNKYLTELCLSQGIRLVYTNNKFTVLSSGINSGGYPVLRVHKKFKDCPVEVDKAIYGYYMDLTYKENHLKRIKDYLVQQLDFKGYIIKEPDVDFIGYWLPKENKTDKKEPVEMSITKIIKKDTKGNMTVIKQDYITPSHDEMMELDITVDFKAFGDSR